MTPSCCRIWCETTDDILPIADSRSRCSSSRLSVSSRRFCSSTVSRRSFRRCSMKCRPSAESDQAAAPASPCASVAVGDEEHERRERETDDRARCPSWAVRSRSGRRSAEAGRAGRDRSGRTESSPQTRVADRPRATSDRAAASVAGGAPGASQRDDPPARAEPEGEGRRPVRGHARSRSSPPRGCAGRATARDASSGIRCEVERSRRQRRAQELRRQSGQRSCAGR